MKIFFTNVLILLSFISPGQSRVVINGGIVSMNNGVILMIDNPDNTAISQTGSGYISSEGINNRIIWSVGRRKRQYILNTFWQRERHAAP